MPPSKIVTQEDFNNFCIDARRFVCTHYEGGQQIREPELEKELGCTRKNARRAIDALDEGGIIRKIKGGHSQLQSLNIPTMQDVIKFHSHSEALPIGQILRNEEDLTPMKRAYEKMKQAFAKAKFPLSREQKFDMFVHNEDFHLSICTTANNPVALQHMRLTFNQMMLFLLGCSDFDEKDFSWEIEEHGNLIQTIEKGIPKDLVDIMRLPYVHYREMYNRAMNLESAFSAIGMP